jgi:hypothetical protein
MVEVAMNEGKHSTRVAIASALVSLVFSIVFAAYIVGQRTGKVLEIDKWKQETAPRIERMDRQGTISFEHFLANYNKEQAEQYGRLKDLEQKMNTRIAPERILKMEEEIHHLDTLALRVERLEQKVGTDGKPNP